MILFNFLELMTNFCIWKGDWELALVYLLSKLVIININNEHLQKDLCLVFKFHQQNNWIDRQINRKINRDR